MPLLEDNSFREQAQPNDFSPEVVKCLDDLIDLLIDLKLLDKKQLIKLPGESNFTSEVNTHEEVEITEESDLTSELDTHEEVEITEESHFTSKLDTHEEVEITEESHFTSEVNAREEVEITEESDLTSELDTHEEAEITEESHFTSELDNLESIAPVKALEDTHEPFSQAQLITNLHKKLSKLEQKVTEPTDLINPLIPLIAELLRLKVHDSRESLFQAVVPIIDQVIEKRSREDIEKMSAAIATALPSAISREIKDYPQEIGKAIAPEIALAMGEQIRLEQHAIARTLGPEMGEAIKNQIRLERDAMVDALYPVIGNTIAKYMMELVQSINDKIENTLSVEGINRKIRAKIQGVSEAELIFREAMGFSVQAIFLIHKVSGLVIAEVQTSSKPQLEADMLAGMLTAIRSFANDCITTPEKVLELHEIDYDNAKIILEVAGYCYLAAIVKGEPSKLFIEKLEDTLSQIILDYDKPIKDFEGDPATIPERVRLLLEKLIEPEVKTKKSKSFLGLLLLVLVLLLPLVIIQYRAHVASRLETKTTVALDATPELSVYRLTPRVRNGKITLTGRVPNEYFKEQAGEVASTAAPHLELDNQIIAVKVPADPVLTAGDIERVTRLLNQRGRVVISSHYQGNTVTVEGIITELSDGEQIVQAFKQIPGVDVVLTNFQKLPSLEQRIYFERNSAQLKSPDIPPKIQTIQQFLAQNPQVHLRIVGHTDSRGEISRNQQLAIARARAVQKALIAQKVNPERLHISGSLQTPPDLAGKQPLWLSRCVRFEVFIPPLPSQ